MSSKRGLTGGTQDVNPQFLGAFVTESAGETYTEVEIPMPIARLPSGANQAIVVEVLKVFWDVSDLVAIATATETDVAVRAALIFSSDSQIRSINNPNVLTQIESLTFMAFTAGGTYRQGIVRPVIQDLTDGAGHGVLVASNSLFLGVRGNGPGTLVPQTAVVKILYRFKRVSIVEYVGIVQSQS